MKLLQMAKFDLANGLYPNVSNSIDGNVLIVTQICIKLFSFAQI